MLLSLHIENLAVIRNIDIDFSKGFTVFTGETGAGKSIIIDGINEVLPLLSESGITPDEEGNLLVQRTLTAEGKSVVKINGRTVTLALLKEITPALIAIHGQNDTRSLTSPEKQLETVDIYAENTEILKEYQKAFSEYEGIKKQIYDLTKKEAERERLIEILRYQVEDIDAYALKDGEEEELVDKKVKIKNSEKITKNAGFVFKALKGSEKGSVSYLLDRSATALEQLSDVIPDFQGFAETLRDFSYRASDIAEDVYAVMDDVEDTDSALNEIEERLDKISKLKRKYGFTIKDILEYRERSYRELEALENSESTLRTLEKQKSEAYKNALGLADILHERRVNASKTIEKSVKETLEFLDMPKVVFFISCSEGFDGEEKRLTKYGSDNIEFFISANRGADAMPLSKVASGGELARVMLAIKNVISDKDAIDTVIFDEIDAGVSGKTARKIGIKMLSLSKNEQLIAVTHSAQIASLADTHILIKKSDVDGKTETSLEFLDNEGRVGELSRILGGIDITDSQRMAAFDMLSEREVYKKG